MTGGVQRSSEWIYRGIWRVLVECFRMPQQPPSMPVEPLGFCHTFHPSLRYLAYLKMYFWIVLVAIDLAMLGGWIALLAWRPSRQL